MTNVNIKPFQEGKPFHLPEKQSEQAAAYDLCCSESFSIRETEIHVVPTNLVMEIPPGLVGKIYPRSGLAAKYGITLANGVGVIDSDYRGEVKVILYRLPTSRFQKAAQPPDVRFTPGSRVAQIIFEHVPGVGSKKVDEVSETERGAGGLGSTGV